MLGRSAPSLSARLLVVLVVAVVATGCVRARPDDATRARLERDIGQLLLVGFDGTTAADNAELEHLLCDVRVGGVLLFGRNVKDREQDRELTRAIAARTRACTGRPILIGTDAEGGQVMRLGPSAGYGSTLSHQRLGEDNDLAETELEARRIGTMLHDAGINWDLAPVVDVGYNPANPVIVGHERSFGANPLAVAAQAAAYIRGMHAAGVLTALKHFPGHGSSFGDSHEGFVDVTRTADPDIELIPYRKLIAEGLVDSVMTAHVFNRRLDRHVPATLSRATITGLLRDRLGFRGVVVTDDLEMGAIQQHYGLADAAVRALDAGADMLLIAQDRLPTGESATDRALASLRRAIADGRLSPARIDEALDRVRELTARLRQPSADDAASRG